MPPKAKASAVTGAAAAAVRHARHEQLSALRKEAEAGANRTVDEMKRLRASREAEPDFYERCGTCGGMHKGMSCDANIK